jgi:L-ascorbate metabolism protein UlaG (beta-lactamase superfamily)
MSKRRRPDLHLLVDHRRFRLLAGLALAAVVGWVAVGALPADGMAAKGGKGGGKAGAGKLTWYGQSCFLLESPGGARVVMDPIPAGLGYTPPAALAGDVVTVSHEHGDHNNVALVVGKPVVLRGLTPDKKGWVPITQKVKDVAIRSVGVYHDDKEGKERGLNAVFVFETGGRRIAHLGDLGHLLTDKQLADIGKVDVLLIPVGGAFTIDAAQATRVVDQLQPRQIVLPMHYRTDVVVIQQLAPVDAFLAGKARVRREAGNSLDLPPAAKGKGGAEAGPEIVVLNYK